jgi:hypothetical protein
MIVAAAAKRNSRINVAIPTTRAVDGLRSATGCGGSGAHWGAGHGDGVKAGDGCGAGDGVEEAGGGVEAGGGGALTRPLLCDAAGAGGGAGFSSAAPHLVQ